MTAPPRSAAERLLLPALLLMFVVVSVQYSHKVLTTRDGAYTRGAINRWAAQLQDMEGGENIHAKYNYPNPPVMAQLLWPVAELAAVSPLAGALVWFYLKVGLVLLCFRWTFRLVETPEFCIPPWGKVLGVGMALRPIMGDLTHGNVNIFILFLVTGCLYAFSRGKDVLSGLLLALAVACKVTPALFVVYFLWKRSGRVLAGTAAGLALFFFVVPSAVFAVQERSAARGWERNWAALTAWVDGMIVPYLVRNVVTPERENQSLPGALTRLLTASSSHSGWVDGVYTPLAFHNIADLSPELVKRGVQACQLLFLAGMVWLCRRPVTPPAPRGGLGLAAEFSYILIGMLLFSERTWKHHCVTLLLPFVVLAAAVAAPAAGRALRWRVGLLLAVACALFSSTISLKEDKPRPVDELAGITVAVGPTAYAGAVDSGLTARLGYAPDGLSERAQIYGAYTWAFILLLAALAVVMRRERAAAPSLVP